jgi:glucan phosphoethanolaminetransferase (alkaline phosphatase superfamily)
MSFYIGGKNWGHPLSLDIFLVYKKEINILIGSLPFSFWFLVFFASTSFLLILIFLIILSRKLYISIEQSIPSFYTKNNLYLSLLLIPLLPILFFKINWPRKYIYYGDPLLSFFLYEYRPQGELVNKNDNEILNESNNYPENLDFNKKNVILIICDALRSDHLSGNGYSRKTTPFLDSISSLVQTSKVNYFYSNASRSFIGISNILSSIYSLSINNFFIHDLLKKQGYQVNFILGGDFTHFYGLKRSFGKNIDHYHDGFTASQHMKHASMNDDKLVVLNHLDSLEHFSGTPSFFYLHFMSAHEVSTLEPQFKIYEPMKSKSFSFKVDPAILMNAYDNRVTQLDNYLKQTISIFKSKGYLDNSIVVFTADHGQGLGEYGFKGHTNTTYLDEISTPLIIYENGTSQVNKQTIVQFGNHLDIAPTITDLLGIPTPKVWMGTSIFKPRRSNIIFQQENEYYSCIWPFKNKLYQYVYNSKRKSEELFDINLTIKHPAINLIDQFEKSDLNAVKRELADFYSISIK